MRPSPLIEWRMPVEPRTDSTNPGAFGFSPDADGATNATALQTALDRGGSIFVATPGEYQISRTVFIGSNTTLSFGAGVALKKTDEEQPFTHVILNKGALTRSWDHDITSPTVLSSDGSHHTARHRMHIRRQRPGRPSDSGT